MPEVVIDSGETQEERRDSVPPDLEKQFRGLANAYGPRFKVNPGDQRSLWRALADYATRHNLTRRHVELLLQLSVQEKRFLTSDGLWDGLEHFRAGVSRKVVAA